MDNDLTGRTALVTGGSRGIGRACCLTLARAGASVAVNYRSNESAAQETLRQIECISSEGATGSAGARAIAVQADVSQPGDVDRMIAEVKRELGPIELLVNNAGVFDHVPHEETTFDVWRRALDNNLTSAYLVTWAVKPGMIERNFGRIVNITSIAALRGRPTCIAYAVSKAGLTSFTKSVAEALAPHNIRMNAVAPGLIDTEILDGVEQQRLDELIAATPLGRIGRPDDIAEVVLFLLSERSRFMTGQTLVASGGRVLLP